MPRPCQEVMYLLPAKRALDCNHERNGPPNDLLSSLFVAPEVTYIYFANINNAQTMPALPCPHDLVLMSMGLRCQ